MSAAIPPWSDACEWRQIHLFFQASWKNRGDLVAARALACSMAERFGRLEETMDDLCRSTCPTCTDVCCIRATVWYDFRDLLYLYLLDGALPPGQISRDATGRCCNLDAGGCRLERSRRPFICTWYLCPDQMTCLDAMQKQSNLLPAVELERIRDLRKELEERFVAGAT